MRSAPLSGGEGLPRLAVLLALLCAAPARAQDAAAPATTPEAQATMPEPEAAEADVELTDAPDTWMEPGGTAVNLEVDGVAATVDTGVAAPPTGWTALRVRLENRTSAPARVRLAFGADLPRGGGVTREVELGPRERTHAFLHVPVEVSSGRLALEVGGAEPRRAHVYLGGAGDGRAVLVLGTAEGFGRATGLARASDRQNPGLQLRALPPAGAPRELTAYVGYTLVAVPAPREVPDALWPVLEAYAATGGTLLVAGALPADVAQRLLPPTVGGPPAPGAHPVGLGEVRTCPSVPACRAQVLTLGDPQEPREPVRARAFSGEGEWMYTASGGAVRPLLEQARVPMGGFVATILLFTLAVGPGGALLARRKGPVWLLLAVPAVALVTCAGLVAFGLLAQGLDTHAARYSWVVLDRAQGRAASATVSGWYANLPPDALEVPASASLLTSEAGAPGTEADWTPPGRVRRFVPSRTYREWGELALTPTRARLVVARTGGRVEVLNALGAPLEGGLVLQGGEAWQLPALADGARGEATPAGAAPEAAMNALVRALPEPLKDRFRPDVLGRGRAPLREGEFLARVGGPGFGPGATADARLREGVHLVRGKADGR